MFVLEMLCYHILPSLSNPLFKPNRIRIPIISTYPHTILIHSTKTTTIIVISTLNVILYKNIVIFINVSYFHKR